MRRSLRFKVALAFFAATIVLLVAQALGVRALAESQEERLIRSVIADDMRDLLESYRTDPASLPPLDPTLHGRVSQEGGLRIALPASFASLDSGVHEVIFQGRELHVVAASLGGERIYRVYDYSAYERHFKQGMNALTIGTGVFVLAAIGLAYWVSGLLVRQVAGLAQQVKALRSGAGSGINPGRYDEHEVAELAEALNDYHRRMADMVEREKEFTANVSHELRTPLTAIRTSCELLEGAAAAFEPKSRQRLQQIEQAARQMQALVECLLALAREESATAIEQVALGAAVDAALAHHAERLAQRSVRAVSAIPAGLRVLANAPALAIVVSNLVDNALQHSEGGTIRFSYRDGALRIEDSGSGIAPDALPHVFERFYRVPGARPQGFGLGLAIVKKICDRYGWPITLESQPGQGTRVTLGLPAIGKNGELHKNFTNP
jgi:signal transduction histidine kinase